MKKPKGTAYPDFLPIRGDGGWSVRQHDKPTTKINERVMDVPLGTNEVDTNIRRAEVGAVKYSPAVSNHEELGVSLPVLAAAESARITHNLTRAGLDMSAGYLPEGVGTKYAEHLAKAYAEDPAQALQAAMLFMAAHNGTKPAADFKEAVSGADIPDMEKICEQVREGVNHQMRDFDQKAGSPYEVTEVIAPWLEALSQVIEDREERKADDSGSGEGAEKDASGNPADAAEDLERSKEQEGELEKKVIEGGAPQLGRFNGWGDLRIETPQRVVRVIEKLKGRKRKASDRGARLRYLHRYVSDHKVFARKAKRPGGGSVLIDASGSMSTTPEQIDRLTTIVPASTSAMYEGMQTGYRSGTPHGWGRLVLLSKHGRRVAESEFETKHGANLVDLPALKWLAEQPEPRIWVSDGYVTDRCERNSAEAARQCRAFRRQNKIYRVDNTEVAIAYFEYLIGKRTLEEFKAIRQASNCRICGEEYEDGVAHTCRYSGVNIG